MPIWCVNTFLCWKLSESLKTLIKAFDKLFLKVAKEPSYIITLCFAYKCAVLPAQQQFGVVLALQVAVDEVWQQVFKDVCGVLQSPLQGSHDEWGHVAAVPHGERTLHFQRSDEGEQEHFVVDELAKQLQGLLHILLTITWHLDTTGKGGLSLLFL